jgi:crotonobetainyl-CoA:carnitine CoA-transferase CaiB-like acyl-CoA transferase
LLQKLEETGLPFAPINRPQDMFDDAHLNAAGGLLDITLTDGSNKGNRTRLPALPLQFEHQRPAVRKDVPKIGEHTAAVLDELRAAHK